MDNGGINLFEFEVKPDDDAPYEINTVYDFVLEVLNWVGKHPSLVVVLYIQTLIALIVIVQLLVGAK